MFVEIQVVPFVQVVGRKKAEGQVALPHWTHGEGRHQPVGEPKGAIGRREDSNSFSDFHVQTQTNDVSFFMSITRSSN